MGYIGPAPEFGQLQKQVLTPDSSTVTFTLDFSVANAESILVSYGGVWQEADVAYTTTSAPDITFTFTPQTGVALFLVYLGRLLEVNVPADNSVGSTQLQDNSVGEDELNLSAGAVGEVITSDGAGGISFVGGGMALLATATASASSTIDFDTGIDFTAYKKYVLEFMSLVFSADGSILELLTSNDGGSTYDVTAGDYRWGYDRIVDSTATSGTRVDSSDNSIRITNTPASVDWGNVTDEGVNGTITLWDPSNTSLNTYISFKVIGTAESGDTLVLNGGGRRTVAEAVDGIRLFPDTGTFTSGTFKLYGVA